MILSYPMINKGCGKMSTPKGVDTLIYAIDILPQPHAMKIDFVFLPKNRSVFRPVDYLVRFLHTKPILSVKNSLRLVFLIPVFLA